VFERNDAAEDRIAKDAQFNELAATYQHQLLHSSELQRHNYTIAESLTELSSQHAAVCDRLEGVQEHLAAKSDKVSDTGPVQTIREALSALRREISQLTIRTGVTMQQLTAARQRRQEAKRNQLSQRRPSVQSGSDDSKEASDSMMDVR
jgi:Intra-flagellar transport protein 57